MSETVRMENWSVIADLRDPYKAPDSAVCLHGKVYGHPSFLDGTEITTSPILAVSPENPREVHTCNTRYCLGEVDPDYVERRRSIGQVFDPNRPIVLVGTKRIVPDFVRRIRARLSLIVRLNRP
jgi:hypothetical protein